MTIVERNCHEAGLCDKGRALAEERSIGEFDAQIMCIHGCRDVLDFAQGFNNVFGPEKVSALECGVEATIAFNEAGQKEDEEWF